MGNIINVIADDSILTAGKVDPAKSAEENIAVCDRRLYIAKETGRNRVVKEG